MKILVFGGAGFLGSRSAARLVRGGHEVVIVDGFLAGTGASKRNLATLSSSARIIASRVEELDNPSEALRGADLVIDAMAWTSHRDAFDAPTLDLEINARSHLVLAEALAKHAPRARVIYLASRGQYGRPRSEVITEETPMVPLDYQGIHKVAGESYYRLHSARQGTATASLRLPNCFGPGQKTTGSDIGLVGQFIRRALNGEAIEVFGAARHRNVVFGDDAAEVLVRLAESSWEGFAAFNLAGHEIGIRALAELIVDTVGSGGVTSAPLEGLVAEIDGGDARFDGSLLDRRLGGIPKTPLRDAIKQTVSWFRREREAA